MATESQEGGRFAKFAEPARRVVVNAQNIAGQFNHRSVDTIHLARACIKDVGVTTFLTQAGVKVDKVLDLVASGLSQYNPSIESEGLTPKAKTAVEHCVGEARRVYATRIEAMHLLTGLLEIDEEVGEFFETPELTLEQFRKQAAAFNDRKNSVARCIQASLLASISK